MTANFVIGTGRCGSTLISGILGEHPDVLSLSELFAALGTGAFARRSLTGRELWEMLSQPRERTTALLQHGPRVREFLDAGGRGEGVAPIMLVTLPHLSDDPASLLEEIGEYLRPLPAAQAATRFTGLFSWLCARLGRRMWVERSGGSLRFVRHLRDWWPTARYVCLVRDGRDTALSMSGHGVFRMAVAEHELRGRDGPQTPVSEEALLAAAARAAASGQIPLEKFGELWSWQIVSAMDDLRSIPSSHVLRLRYEFLVADPERALRDLLGFFGLAEGTPDGWVQEQAHRVRAPATSWLDLPEPERTRLDRACRMGQRLLAGRAQPMAGDRTRREALT